MPRVPTYGDPNVQLAAAPDLRDRRTASADEFGAGIAQGIGEAANQAGRVYVDEQQKAIRQAKQVRLLGLKNEYDNYMAPKQAEWSQRRGLDAQQNITEFRSEHTKLLGQLTADLDPDTREAFEAYAADAYTHNNRKLLFQAAEQAVAYDNDQYKARRDLFRTKVVQAGDDAGAIAEMIAAQKQEDTTFAERNGLGEEGMRALYRATDSLAVRAHIESLLDADMDIKAAEAFKVNKHLLSGEDLEVMRKAVEVGSSKAMAARIGDEVYDAVTAGTMTAEQAITHLREKTDSPTVRAMATAHYRSLMGMREEARRAETGQAWDEAMRALAENNGDIGTVSTAAMTRLLQLDPSSVDKLNRIASNWDPGRQTDDMAWLSLREAAVSGELAKMDTIAFHEAFHDKFSRADWDNASALYGQAKEAALKPDKNTEWMGQVDGFRSELDIVKDVLAAQGYDYDAVMKGDPQDETVQSARKVITALDYAVAQRKRELSVQAKRRVDKLPPDEMHRVVGSTLQAIAEKGPDPWFGGSQENLPVLKQVPPEEAAKVREAWKAKGHTRELSDTEVANYYFRAQGKGR